MAQSAQGISPPYRLRDRHKSSKGDMSGSKEQIDEAEGEGEQSLSPDPDKDRDSSEHNDGSPNKNTSEVSNSTNSNEQENFQEEQEEKEQIEIPVVKMSEFAPADMDEKLNYLMAAINKVNTNLHYKLQETKDEITQDMATFEPRIKKTGRLLSGTGC